MFHFANDPVTDLHVCPVDDSGQFRSMGKKSRVFRPISNSGPNLMVADLDVIEALSLVLQQRLKSR